MTEYRTIAAPATASFVEKKSEFIAYLAPVRTAEEAVSVIETVRKNHRRARHNVYAYLLREGNASRYSDDGEPQGTAGMPVLDVLQKKKLTDICCVVTRYFGGCFWAATDWCGPIPTAQRSPLNRQRCRSCYPAIRSRSKPTTPYTEKSPMHSRKQISFKKM